MEVFIYTRDSFAYGSLVPGLPLIFAHEVESVPVERLAIVDSPQEVQMSVRGLLHFMV